MLRGIFCANRRHAAGAHAAVAHSLSSRTSGREGTPRLWRRASVSGGFDINRTTIGSSAITAGPAYSHVVPKRFPITQVGFGDRQDHGSADVWERVCHLYTTNYMCLEANSSS